MDRSGGIVEVGDGFYGLYHMEFMNRVFFSKIDLLHSANMVKPIIKHSRHNVRYESFLMFLGWLSYHQTVGRRI